MSSQWNLSVRLTGQGASLSRALRDTSRDARRASRDVNALQRDITRLRATAAGGIRVRIRVDAASLRTDVRNAINRADTGRGIRVRLRVDAGNLRTDVRNAISGADPGSGLAVNLRLADTMQLRRDVADAVRWAAWGHQISIPIRLADAMQLRRDVTAAVRWAQMDQVIRIRVDADTSALTGLTRTLSGGGSGGGARGLLAGLLLLAPAVIPLTTALASLPGILLASGAAATTFGIAVAGQIAPLAELSDAEQKYEEAVRQHGTTSEEAIKAQLEYQSQLSQLPAETQQAAVAFTQLKQSYRAFSDSLSGDTMQPVIHSLTVMDALLPHMAPSARSFSRELDRVVTLAGGAMETPGFDAAADRFDAFTDQTLQNMGDRLVHVMRLLSEGKTDGPLTEVFAYIEEHGDAARETLSNLGDAVGNLFEGTAEAGPTMLTLVNAVARLVGALPPELIGTIIQIAAALKLLQLAGAGAAAIAGGIATVQARIAALHATSVAAGGGLAGLQAAFMSLGTAAKAGVIVAGIGLAVIAISKLMDLGQEAPPNVDRLTSSLAKLGQSGKVTGELAKAYGEDLDDLYDKVRNITDPSVADNIQNGLVKVLTLGFADSTPSETAREHLDALDESLTALVKGGKAEQAAAALERVKAAYTKDGGDAENLVGQLTDYQAAVADASFEQELAAASMGLFGQAALDTQAKLEAQKKSADGLRQSIQALADLNRQAAGSMNAFEQAIDDANEAAAENAGALKMSHGELDLNSQEARDAESALRDLAASTDDAVAKAREQGKSWEYVLGIMDRGQDSFVATAQKMGLTKAQAEALAKSYLGIPDKKTTVYEMRTEAALESLEAVIAAIKRAPNKKSVTVDALTDDAIAMLEELGFTVTHLKDGRFKVTAHTKSAKDSLDEVQRARDGLKNKDFTLEARDKATAIARAIQRAIDNIRGKSVTVTTVYRTLGAEGTAARNAKNEAGFADGGVVDYYADGGIQRGGVRRFATGSENHVAQIAPAGTWRVWAEPETGGEGYVPFAPSKRPRSRAITEEIVRRLGGDPAGIQWNADGNVTDWRYDPQTGSLYSASDAGQAGRKTRKVKVKGKNGKVTIREVEYFDLGAVEKKIKSAAAATRAWNADLEKVADRAGTDVAEALASMGEEGRKLADKMANGSTKYLQQMAKALLDLQKTARASLTDYTRQLGSANKVSAKFADDLAKLAGKGFGDLAAQLAAQGDEAAQQLAAAAAKDPKKAAQANAQAKRANNALTGEQVAQLVQIIAAITNKNTGIHAVAAKTGIGEDVIIEIGNKARRQIGQALGSRADRFFADLVKANRHQAYADGGLRAGIYATRGGIVRFAEPETGGEAYVPLSASKRHTALPVLHDVARRFGVGLTDASASRPVVIVQSGDTITVPVTTTSPHATASDIGAQVGWQFRRAKRGGVAARAGAH